MMKVTYLSKNPVRFSRHFESESCPRCGHTREVTTEDKVVRGRRQRSICCEGCREVFILRVELLDHVPPRPVVDRRLLPLRHH